jgi:apolipoprotein D and lipocalin family protein
MRAKPRFVLVILATIILGGCAAKGPEMKTVDYVDIDRFMGSWYVIANIPTFLEKEAYNAVETYSLNNDGTIATNFKFRKGGFDGKAKEYNPKAFVLDEESNARWATTIPRQLSVGRIVTLSGSWRVRLRSLPSTMTN